jgi:subtilisin family serine protease
MVLLMVAGTGAAYPSAQASEARAESSTSQTGSLAVTAPHAPREIVVRYRPGLPSLVRQISRFSVTGELIQRLPLRGAEVMKVAPGTDLTDAIEVLERRPDVLYAEPNYIYEALETPNDPFAIHEWALDDPVGDIDLDAPEAWDVTTGSKDVVVAVADSGVAYDHPDLADNIWTNPGEFGDGKQRNGIDDDNNGFVDDWHGWDWIGNDNNPSDLLGHGTHVSGTLGASGNNGIGVTGVNWNVSILPLRILELDGTGTAADLASAFVYARRAGAKVVNASLGGPHNSRTMAAAIKRSPNTLFVVASGNSGDNLDSKPNYPCSYPDTNILCVAATNSRGKLAGFSNYGDRTVDVAAPGTEILSTLPNLELVFNETFENDPGARWDTGGSKNSWATDSDSLGAYMADSPAGRYKNSTNSWLESRSPVDMPEASACGLDFALRLDTEPGADGLLIETSPNGSRWTQLTGLTGRSRGWQAIKTDIPGGRDVFLRFRMVSNRAVRRDGVQIDNVRIRCALTQYSSSDYNELSGTSMAAPQAAGAAALLWSYAPTARPSQIRYALIVGSVGVPSLSSKVVAGGRLNLVGGLTELAKVLGLADPFAPEEPEVPSPTPSESPTILVEPSPSGSPVPTPSPTP